MKKLQLAFVSIVGVLLAFNAHGHPIEFTPGNTAVTSEKVDKAASYPSKTLSQAVDPNDANAGGVGDLLVAPTRVVLGGRVRAAEIMLNNRGTQEATYRISFSHIKMDDDGRYVNVDDKTAKNPTLKFADNILRYSPHQVTLKAGETQVVKVMVRPTEGLADGEYCSHLLFRAMPNASAGNDIERLKPEPGRISIRLIPIYGVSIPVIVRRGRLSAQARLRNARLVGHHLLLSITRSGSASVYGDVIATEKKSGKVVGQLRGIAVLATNARRNIAIPLAVTAKGEITIEYRERAGDGGKTLDKTAVTL